LLPVAADCTSGGKVNGIKGAKMKSKHWMMWMTAGLLAAVAVGSGCKKKTTGNGTGEGANSGGRMGTDMGESRLATRPDMSTTEIPSQFAPVYFDFDSSQIKGSERAKIEIVAQRFKTSTASGVIVEGNCDERGSAEYNLALGECRALAMRASLMDLGLDTAHIQTKSFGKEKPVAPGHDEEAWAKNRRADFVLFK